MLFCYGLQDGKGGGYFWAPICKISMPLSDWGYLLLLPDLGVGVPAWGVRNKPEYRVQP